MCGIVGYIGKKEARDILLEGLARLEYRGYDSAGIAVYNDEEIVLVKNKGRLKALKEKIFQNLKLNNLAFKGKLGIGHTRWATHGVPCDINAHPHIDKHGKFAIVHNGIIENFGELKEKLLKEGFKFTSDTDSEVVAHMLAFYWTKDLFSTVRKVISFLKGAFALGIISSYEPDKLIAVRMSCPLVIGIGRDENFIASDIPAILKYTNKIIILEDNDIAVIKRNNLNIFSAKDGKEIYRNIITINWSIEEAEKGGFKHFMLKEINEQPKAIRDTILPYIKEKKVDLSSVVNLSKTYIQNLKNIHIVACGTAYHAGLVGKNILENFLRIPVEVDIASEYRYRQPILSSNTLVIIISQSGETADTLAALREAKKKGARILVITNVFGSSAAREADDVILTMAGPEIAVASTKAYTSQLAVLYLLGLYFAQELRTLEKSILEKIVENLVNLPAKIDQILKEQETYKEVAFLISKYKNLFFLGRGLDYAVALEASLKLKEISYIHSQAYAAGELKHGTLALVEEGFPILAILTQSSLYDKMLSNIQEVKARGAYVIGFVMQKEEGLEKYFDKVFMLPKTLDLLSPILAIVPLQLLAYYTCVLKGFDVDKPRNLAKSVTVE